MANIVTGTSVINLDISIWTGKARLQRNEIDDTNLPPEALATLGSKKLFDPEKLKRFHGIKSSAFAACNKVGVRFLSGWLVGDKHLTGLTLQLQNYLADWSTELGKLTGSYGEECEAWLAQNAQWASILRSAMPTVYDVASRFHFGWHVFNVVPAPVDVPGNELKSEVSGVATRAMEKMAKAIADKYGSYEDPSRNLLTTPLCKLADQCRALAFSAPEIDKLGEVLDALAVSGSARLAAIVMKELSDPAKIADICRPDEAPEDILASITPLAPAPEPAPDVEALVQEAQDVLDNTVQHEEEPAPVTTVQDMADMIDSGGLW